MLKVTILQNFATIGIPDFDVELGKNWSIVALSNQLIDENRLRGLQQLNTRRLDLVIHNGRKIALLNLQAFKIFECPLATNVLQQCLTHHLSSDGNLLFGIQPSGDVIILTGGLQAIKHVKKPTYIKIQTNPMNWYDFLPIRLLEYFSGGSRTSQNKSNQVSPEQLPTATSSRWWPFQSSSTLSGRTQHHNRTQSSENIKSQFPYITALPDGLAMLCVYSPVSCYVFVSSYETALRSKSVANIKGSHVQGKWYRISMQKDYIVQWLEERKCVQWFEAKLCYCNSHELAGTGSNIIGGAMLYAVQKGLGLEITYGLIKRQGEKFILNWEKVEYEVDWALEEPRHNLVSGSRFVARLSGDCTKMAVIISTNLGMHLHIQDLFVTTNTPVKIRRSSCALCNHSDYDGTHFYKKDCWISDIQWLVEDAYISIMTMCGSLSIFYVNSGEPMVLKVRRPGTEPDESKSARFFYAVFHPHQICSVEKDAQEEMERSGAAWEQNKASLYPTIKWLDSEKILSCSSGRKIELFSIQRVMNLPKENQVLPTVDNIKDKLEDKSMSDAVIASSSQDTDRIQVRNPTANCDGEMQAKEKPPTKYFPSRSAEMDRVRSIDSTDKLPTSPLLQSDSELLIRPASVYSHNSIFVRHSPVSEYRLTSGGNTISYPAEDDCNMDNNIDGMSTSTTYKDNGSASSTLNSQGGEFDDEEEEDKGRPRKIMSRAKPEQVDDHEAPAYNIKELPPLQYSNEFMSYANDEGIQKGQLTCRKLSQQYMADDESSDGGEGRNSRRKPFSGKSRDTGGWSTGQTLTTATSLYSVGHPLSSGQYEDTEEASYSSPFSYVPTSAGEDYDHDGHHKQERVTSASKIILRSGSPTPRMFTPSHNQSSNDMLATSSSTNQVRLQMPPVPVISAVIIPSTRASVSFSPPSPRPEVLTEGTQVENEFYMPPTHSREFRSQIADFTSDRMISENNALDQNINELRLTTGTSVLSIDGSPKTSQDDPGEHCSMLDGDTGGEEDSISFQRETRTN